MKLSQFFLTTSILATLPCTVLAMEPVWKDVKSPPGVRAKALVNAMTQDEKLQLVMSRYALGNGPKHHKIPEGALGSAGYVPGIPRLGIPAQQITDAGLGVTNPNQVRPNDGATGMPSGQILSGTFDPDLAYEAGKVMGKEAFHRGFNVLLGGGTVLVRDPRNGRNFEYLGEDPLLAGNIAAAQIQGVQSQHVLSTVKHFAFNAVETNRMKVDMKIGERAGRESDLLAFEIAVKQGEPGAIMCAYNKVNGIYSCENSYLLQLPKKAWGYRGYILTDWGATHSTVAAANAGLDQESAAEFDAKEYFGKPLKIAIKKGEVPQGRLDNMAYRILYSMIHSGLYDHPATKSFEPEDVAAHEAVAQQVAENGMVLLKNHHNILPLSPNIQSIAIIGGNADKGVLSGGGSSQVTARGGNIISKTGPKTWPGPISYFPSSPMKAIEALAPKARVNFASGENIQAAVDLAKQSDVAIVFATKWSAEAFDSADLQLSDAQNKSIEAVAKTGKPVVVVLETGNPVEMPWLHDVDAVLAAWYPGTAGGPAIANILFGRVNPSGRLTTTWPKALSQVPYPYIEGAGKIINADPGKRPQYSSDNQVVSSIDLNEDGANVGYRWYEQKRLTPLFPFGYGLSYTTFKYKKLNIVKNFTSDKHTMIANVTVKNTGNRDGADVIQVYGKMPDGSPSRLLGFRKVDLKAGETKTFDVPLFPASLSHYEPAKHDWEIVPGNYEIFVRPDALSHEGLKTTMHLDKIDLPD
ncbi:beta-glucosidase [Commensalibacter oyaizuii]|uniref:Glycoside hydrolase family 3 C-terminal domain-containing protein n=1 Tax=Commensalibacter oyaizuii TaxID=3043873 RepID=A0ABT6Q196_9PROT|nr:glycoside hydrolase family 3 C-terminal domain-containing protein [Commensalibacter sp. TBRC 16381]MDI2090775.1 glycoside hydrolase family 3 C-terminal domain-containing protein [Commensalibacter sp. TBRC 16381]